METSRVRFDTTIRRRGACFAWRIRSILWLIR